MLELGKKLDAAIADAKAQVPTGVEIDQITDQPQVVEESVSEFLRSFVEALGIVLVVSFISLGWRSGTRGRHLGAARAGGGPPGHVRSPASDLDRITLGSLIIALGLLVDDAIIAVEMMVVKMEQGWTACALPPSPGTSTAFPMLTGTLVTAAGFLPVGSRAIDGGRICRQHLLDRRPGADRVVVRGRHLHALHRREAAAGFLEARCGSMTRMPFTDTRIYRGLRTRRRLERPSPLGRRCADARRLRLGHCGLHPGAAAVLPDVVAAGAVHRDPHAGGHVHRRHRGRGARRPKPSSKAIRISSTTPPISAKARRASSWPRTRVLPNENFALIVMMTKGAEARERLKTRLEGLCRRQRHSGSAPAHRPAELRTARRLPGAVPRHGARQRQRARAWPTRCATPCAPIRTHATCSSTGTSRRSRSGSKWIRIVHARWG